MDPIKPMRDTSTPPKKMPNQQIEAAKGWEIVKFPLRRGSSKGKAQMERPTNDTYVNGPKLQKDPSAHLQREWAKPKSKAKHSEGNDIPQQEGPTSYASTSRSPIFTNTTDKTINAINGVNTFNTSTKHLMGNLEAGEGKDLNKNNSNTFLSNSQTNLVPTQKQELNEGPNC